MENKTSQTKIEVHFYATPYMKLVDLLDWRGILLKAHVNWLGQKRTHCSIRVKTDDELDFVYQATWDGLIMCKTATIKYKPINIIDITNFVCPIKVTDNLKELFETKTNTRIALKTMLQLMHRKHEEVVEMTCTSFIADAMGLVPLKSYLLYPDNFYNGLKEWIYTWKQYDNSNREEGVSSVRQFG